MFSKNKDITYSVIMSGKSDKGFWQLWTDINEKLAQGEASEGHYIYTSLLGDSFMRDDISREAMSYWNTLRDGGVISAPFTERHSHDSNNMLTAANVVIIMKYDNGKYVLLKLNTHKKIPTYNDSIIITWKILDKINNEHQKYTDTPNYIK